MPDERLLHVIRLRGPWDYEVVLSEQPNASGTQNAPIPAASLVGADFRGVIRFQRRFGWPEKLDPDERVYLVLDTPGRMVQAELNGVPLDVGDQSCSLCEVDITTQLQRRNRLALDLELSPGSDEVLLSGTRLEIRRA